MANDRRNTFTRAETDQDYGTCDDCGQPIKAGPYFVSHGPPYWKRCVACGEGKPAEVKKKKGRK